MRFDKRQLGFLEILLWHLVEVGELGPMGLPVGSDSLAALAAAIEQRLSKFIQLKQFHFRFTKEMIFDIVHDCSSWEPDKTKNDVQNLRAAFDNIEGWGIPALVDPPDIKNMGSVNERGFLMFFAFFLPSLEGVAGPKRKKSEAAPPPAPVAAVDTSAFTEEIERLKAQLAEAAALGERLQGENAEQAREIADLKQRCQELEGSSRSSEVALQQLHTQMQESDAAHAEKTAALAEQCEQSEAARQATEARLREVEAQLQAAGASSQEERQRLLAEFESSKQAMLGSAGQLQQELLRVKAEAEAAKKAQANQMIQLRSELEDVQLELDELRQETASSKKVTSALALELQHANITRQESVSSISKDKEALHARVAELEALCAKQAEKLEHQNFDGLESGYQRLLVELNSTRIELTEARLDTEKVMKQMRALELKMPLFLRQGKNTVEPPRGDVTLVFTDVEGSTVQWEWDAEAMAPAIRAHNDLLRSLLEEHGGYEVKTEGDAFMCAFADPLVAVQWCLDAQEKLLHCKWPEKIYHHEKSRIVTSEASGRLLYQGLRVRMGVHSGAPSCEEDPVTGRMDYFGPMVNRAARVESVAHGGQIVMSSDVRDRVAEQLQSSRFAPQITDLGSFELKGLQEATHIYQILPGSLTERVFEAAVSKETELSNEKKKLQEQLQELQERNEQLAQKLAALDENVKGQINQATQLLSDVQDARFDSQPPKEMLNSLRQQLQSLLQGQTATAEELERAKTANEELVRVANEAAERRERIAVQSILLEKRDLELSLGDVRAQAEQWQRQEEELRQQMQALEEDMASAGQAAASELAAARGEESALREQVRALEASLQAAEGESRRVADLRGLQAAMARRIETLESEIDGARDRASKSAAVLRNETDRWAAVETDLKKQIRDLETRIRKYKKKVKDAST